MSCSVRCGTSLGEQRPQRHKMAGHDWAFLQIPTFSHALRSGDTRGEGGPVLTQFGRIMARICAINVENVM